MGTLIQDLRYGLRVLAKNPGFTAVAVLTLALGIGANTAIFSLINVVMLKMLPVKNPEQLLLVGVNRRGLVEYGFTYRKFKLLRDHNRFFSDLAAFSPVRLNVSVDGQSEPVVEGQTVSGGYFSALGVSAVIGRSFSLEDDRVVGGHPVAMISYAYWRRRFALAPSAVGRTILIDGTPFTIIGVTPPEFLGLEVGSAPDVSVPLMMQPQVMPAAENWLENPINTTYWLRIVGRLRSGVSQQQALADADALYHMDSASGDRVGPEQRLVLTSGSRGLSELRQQFSHPLLILMGIVGLVLLIACANVANLLLARAAARQREIAVRIAVGAGRWRLIRQLLTESLLLATLGGVCGVLFATWGTDFLVALMSTGRTPIFLNLRPDVRVLAFTAAASLLTGILFGIAPALRATHVSLSSALKEKSGRLGGGSSRWQLGKVLVVSQVALSLVLLIAAGLFVRSLRKLNSQDAGFDRQSVLVMRVEPKGSDQKSLIRNQLNNTYRDLLRRVEAIPDVLSASLAGIGPTKRSGLRGPIRVLGKLIMSGESTPAFMIQVYPKYFTTLGIPMLFGRDFNDRDTTENAPFVAVINETMARRIFPNDNPVGKQFIWTRRRVYEPRDVIGVVKDDPYSNLREEPQSVAYQPFLQTDTGRGEMVLHVRIAGNASSIATRIRQEVQAIDKDLPMLPIQTLATEVDASLIQERVIAMLSGFFSLLALLVATIGLYGIMAYAVAQRTNEIGIRMALGAQQGDVLWMVLRETLLLVLIGVVLGIPAALAATRVTSSLISGLLFGLKATDPVTISMAALLMVAIAAFAGYLPARKASRVDPMVALRYE